MYISQTSEKPDIIILLGDGTYYYSYDIVEGTRKNQNDEDETVYSYSQVRVYGRPEYKAIVNAVIREYLTQDQEFDLINSYNKINLGLQEEDGSTEKYLEYLKKLDTIKSKVKSDLNNISY